MQPDDDGIEIMRAYTERFGEEIPDRRAMTPEDVVLVPDKCREALARDRPLTLAEWGVSDELPDDVVI
jgi:hypothetical protein